MSYVRQELPKTPLQYKINAAFAKTNSLPRYFTAVPLVQTEKAAYLFGQGNLEIGAEGICCFCGRKLTHPVSVIVGIGPICGGHYWNWDSIGGFTKENVEAIKAHLKQKIEDIRVDSWIPKSCIQMISETEETVNVPEDHPMIIKQKGKKKEVKRAAKMVTYEDSGEQAIKITFPFNRDDLDKVKSLSGRRFHRGISPYWSCPLNLDNIQRLHGWNFELDDALQNWLKKSTLHVNEVSSDIEIPGLKTELYPFQKQGVAFIEAKDGRALIGDEMGLGKTIQALAWLQLHPEKRPAIIVVPASLKLNWEKEAKKWMKNPNVQVLYGEEPNIPLTGDILIINYDVLSHWVNELNKIKAQVFIADECHYFKNNQTKRTKAVKQIAKHIPHVICLSGTPIVNRPIEGYNALKLIDGCTIPNFWRFAQQYCDAKHNGFGWDFTGATNTDELHELLTNTIMLRRKKEDVLKELPAKMRSIVPMELSNNQEYWKAQSDFIDWVKQTRGKKAAEKASNAEALSRIEGLKQLAVKGKMKQVKSWIQNHLETNGKLVVFAIHKETINQLMQEFGNKAVKIDGSVSANDREKAVESFQNNDSIRLFVGNIKAAGVGITLTAASSVAFLELGWSPGEHDQAEDRIHRIGQQADSINAYYLLADGTIENEIADLIDHKRKVLNQVLDGKKTEESSLLSELLEKYAK